MLTALALSYFPFESTGIMLRDPLLKQSPIKPDSSEDAKPSDRPVKATAAVGKIDYIAMDVAGPHSVEQEQSVQLRDGCCQVI
jgi:hypothetical protein